MVADCRILNDIAQQRRARRLENGSVMFLNREFTFSLDQETRYPLAYQESQKMQSKSLVEEYMLMANILIAEYLFKFCKDKALVRCHNDITDEKKGKLSEFFTKVGLQGVDLTDAASLSHSLEALRATQQPDRLEVMNRKFLTCLT